MAELPAVTVTVAWKPLPQLLVMAEEALQVLPPVGATVGVGVGGTTVGVTVGLTVGDGVTGGEVITGVADGVTTGVGVGVTPPAATQDSVGVTALPLAPKPKLVLAPPAMALF
jgi:hypothetical protein